MALTYLRPAGLDQDAPRHLPRYRHLPGLHGASTALRNAYAHHTGDVLSEALCFGLGAGLGFTCERDPDGRWRVSGRGPFLESRFCHLLGIRLKSYQAEDADLAWTHARGLIDQGRLVMLDLDMAQLPYLAEALELDRGLSLGGHKALLTGYDPAAETAFLADHASAEPQAVSLADLGRARAAADPSPRHTAFTFDFPRRLSSLRPAVRAAIQGAVGQMRGADGDRSGGLASLARFCGQAARGSRAGAGEERQTLGRLAWLTLEKAGTGGGNFRLLYASFLDEASVLLGTPALAAAAPHYRRLGARWRDAAECLREGAAPPAGLLAEITSLEQAGIGMLEDFLAR
jgi:hypothetical protein